MSFSVLDAVLEELRRARGMDLSGYRRGTLERRLAVRMTKLHLKDPLAYLQRLQSDPEEYDRLIETIEIKVSAFFRDPLVFEIIAQRVLPQILERHRRDRSHQIRVWCAGCAAGEEAYSLAIILAQELTEEDLKWAPYICATDISAAALAAAHLGSYHRGSCENIKLGVLDSFFQPQADGFIVAPEIRRLVHFSRHDLTSGDSPAPADSVYGSFDLVLCRNVLIYFSLDLQERVLEKLYTALNPGGYLVLGTCESLPPQIASRLLTVDRSSRIFQKPG